MKVAIMQPYFFPYLGYYCLIKQADVWVIFDTPQFIRHGWIERNRILKPVEGWQYISVPLQKFSQKTAINQVTVRKEEPWQERLLAQLGHYKKKAPYYNSVIDLVKKSISVQTESIVELDDYILQSTCRYLEIPYSSRIFSRMNLELQNIKAPDEWALEITSKLNGKTYLNPPGGGAFFDKRKYEEKQIDLRFINVHLTEYDQKRPVFEPGLSIIDVMMFNSPADINLMLDQYEYVS